MNESLLKSNEFCMGVAVGIGMYQQKILSAHGKGEPILIDGDLYYLQDGRERLKMIIDEICR